MRLLKELKTRSVSGYRSVPRITRMCRDKNEESVGEK